MAKRHVVVPKPVRSEGRICFGINWYATEAEALEAAKAVRARGDTYNGGFFHGMPCGRAPEFDGHGEYAVTTS
jgi:hypothetical protein